ERDDRGSRRRARIGARPGPRRPGAAAGGRQDRRPSAAVAAALSQRRPRAPLRLPASRRAPRPVGDLLDARQRHGLARPRPLLGRRARGAGSAGRARTAHRRRRPGDGPSRGQRLLLRAVAHPPADLPRARRGLDPRLFPAAVAARPVRGLPGRSPAPAVGLLRGRAASARAVGRRV
ncbi:MAG: Cysteine dioxygenase, partial [uncultured Solirubrobacteraceae bacterium]